MSAIESAGRRPRGRPQARPDHATRHLIAAAAGREFTAKGYAGTCMDDVAKGAGVSKKTLYRLVPTKADLFRITVADSIDRFLVALDVDHLADLDVTAALERILKEFGILTLSADTIAIQRLVIGESDRFPEIAKTFYADAIVATYAVLTRYLELQCARGVIELDDPHRTAGMLRGMMIMEPQRAAMLGQSALPSPAEIVDRARVCVRLFLRGCRTDRADEAGGPSVTSSAGTPS